MGKSTHDIDGRGLSDLVEDTALTVLASGFEFVEGPAWHPGEAHLTFNDIPGNRMLRWTPDGHVTSVREPNNMGNGNCYDHRWRLLTCEHATSRLVREELDGTITVLADRYDGLELNSPNDVIVAPDGTILFTDPIYGRTEYYGVPRPPQLDVRGVYSLPRGTGPLTRLTADLEGPNGLCLSPDARHLYVADTERMHVRRFDFDGVRLHGGRVWAQLEPEGPGDPDGMRVDARGNLFCCGPGGVHVFDPDARALGLIRVPEVAANLTWGGDGMRTLFICATSRLYAIRTKVPGH